MAGKGPGQHSPEQALRKAVGGSQAGGSVPPTAAATVRPGFLAGRTACHTGTQVQAPPPVPARPRLSLPCAGPR